MQRLRVDMDIGSNLRRLRKENGFTQDRLIAKLYFLGIDVSRAIYSRYETGELNVPVSTLVALHSLYQCSYDEFFRGLSVSPKKDSDVGNENSHSKK